MSNAIISGGQTAVTPAEAIRDAWIAMIERAAKDPAVDLAKLERMLQLRSQEHARIAAQQYREAMSACQAGMEAVRTDCRNDQTRSKYASLAALDTAARPIYTAHGFSLSFDTDDCEKPDHVRVVCKVYHAAGHAENHSLVLPADGKGARGGDVMTRTHAMGSALSYARRYLLGMIFNLMVERDDDGNAASRVHHRPAPQPARPTPGRHADGQDNRFYREPLHDPRTGEVVDPVQEAEAEAANESREAFISSTREIIRKATDWRKLGVWWNSPEQKKARRDFELTKEEVARLVEFVKARIEALKAQHMEAAE
jgi:hypothetical protein